uniref:Uncharacterized protein n=1 Tax=Callithrix jacchus TaxID=9483 RepID=A0A8I3XB04_CALJA
MLDIALLMANASQLKAIVEQGPSFAFYVPLVVLISIPGTADWRRGAAHLPRWVAGSGGRAACSPCWHLLTLPGMVAHHLAYSALKELPRGPEALDGHGAPAVGHPGPWMLLALQLSCPTPGATVPVRCLPCCTWHSPDCQSPGWPHLHRVPGPALALTG